MPARTSYARVAEILDNNNAEVVLRTTGQRFIAAYFSPTQWKLSRRGAARFIVRHLPRFFAAGNREFCSRIFRLFTPSRPNVARNGGGIPARSALRWKARAWSFMLEAGEEIPLPSARNIPRGHTRVQAAVTGRTFVVDHLRLQSTVLNSGVPRDEYLSLRLASVTVFAVQRGRSALPASITIKGGRLGDFDIARARGSADFARARGRLSGAKSPPMRTISRGVSSRLHSFEWGGDLTVNVGGYTGEFGDEGFVPAAVFNRTDSLILLVTTTVVMVTVHTPTLFPATALSSVYQHYQHAFRFPVSSSSAEFRSSPVNATLQMLSVIATPATLTIRPPAAVGAGRGDARGGRRRRLFRPRLADYGGKPPAKRWRWFR